MAVGTWQIHDKFKQVLVSSLDMTAGSHILRCSLYTGAANLSAGAVSALSVHGSVTNELASASGYLTSGKTLSQSGFVTGASGGEVRLSHDDVFWSATGNITSIQYAVAWFSGASAGARYIMAHLTLSTGAFTLTSGNRLTLTDGSNGAWELN